MIFEIHITGSMNIHEVCETLGVKTIAVELLKPNCELLYIEDMTSFIFKGSEIDMYEKVLSLVGDLSRNNVSISRIKVETPYVGCEHLIEKSKYMETHFKCGELYNSDERFVLPTSRNTKKATFLATDRTYDQSKYFKFYQKYKNNELELCIFDSNVNQDKEWFDLYESKLANTRINDVKLNGRDIFGY